MTFEKSERPIDRWKRLAEIVRFGNRYRIIFYDGDCYEADFQVLNSGEDDVEMTIRNVSVISGDPQYNGMKSMFFGLSEVQEIRSI